MDGTQWDVLVDRAPLEKGHRDLVLQAEVADVGSDFVIEIDGVIVEETKGLSVQGRRLTRGWGGPAARSPATLLCTIVAAGRTR